MKFIIESSQVPIYNRIATAFSSTLIEFGHTVHFINANNFNEIDFVETINEIDFDYYISTNELNFIQRKSTFNDQFLFEKIYADIIFLHHDNLFSAFHDISYIKFKLQAFLRVSKKSHHFCLESSNIELLKSLEVNNTYKINHASEFNTPPLKTPPKWEVTFIGHLMSSLHLYPASELFCGHHLQVLAWNRYSQSSYSLQPQIKKLLNDAYFKNKLGIDNSRDSLVIEQFLMAELNKLSSPMRGQLISTIKQQRVDIFGGDLSYGSIDNPLMILHQDNIHYQPATPNYLDASSIYNSSRINLNISSLQFDTAVNNRFIDIVSSGGFVLTDKRSDLFDICSFANEISFNTPEDLNEKILFFNSKEGFSRHLDIKMALFEDFKSRFTYKNTVDYIFKCISN